MKPKNNLYSILKAICIILICNFVITHLKSQDSTKQIIKKPFVAISYNNYENKLQSISFKGAIKTGQELSPLAKWNVKIFIDDAENPDNLIADLVTDYSGKAVTVIPSQFADTWSKQNSILFIARTDSIPDIGSLESEIEITKCKLLLEAIEEEDKRLVKVTLMEKSDSVFKAVSDAEIKIGVKRLSSILPINEEITVTTDSTGSAMLEYTLDSISGNKAGLITLTAKLEEHELYGTVEANVHANWGVEANPSEAHIQNRSLWASGDKVPWWLLSLALMIIVSVWTTLGFLILQILKIRKLGRLPN